MDSPAFLSRGKLPGGLLNRLLRTYGTPVDATVIVDSSYGFDAAAVHVGQETIIVKSDPITFASTDAARYLVAVNANDIACMGGIPRWLTVVALLPENATTAESVERLFADLRDACEAESVSLIGGHTEITAGIDHPLLVGTLLGSVGPFGLLRPGSAKAGDELWLSHSAAIEGTALLAHEREVELRNALGAPLVARAQALLVDPGISVARDARALLATGAVSALHDPTEGGVATAVHEIAAASGLGARIDAAAIPILAETRAVANHFGIDPLGLLSSGALLIAASPDSEATLRSALVPLSRIGVLTDEAGTITMTTTEGDTPLPQFDADELTRVLG